MNELIDRIAFTIQEDGMSRIEARRLVDHVLAALQEGDEIRAGLVVCAHPATFSMEERRPPHMPFEG
ncbi:hypothetical protein [Aureimonas sp. ME7]|uniref:hypothetical protein n=1 Tax=Aureimonas sp. ME7 TaxID=2744252 RepID=UPI0015F81E23|nr:hypothetical protein [Aureimonas sp. ME7]